MQVYHDGELVKTVKTSLSGDSKVTSIEGSGDHNPGANGLFVDNLAVYCLLYTSPSMMAVSVPCPWPVAAREP